MENNLFSNCFGTEFENKILKKYGFFPNKSAVCRRYQYQQQCRQIRQQQTTTAAQ